MSSTQQDWILGSFLCGYMVLFCVPIEIAVCSRQEPLGLRGNLAEQCKPMTLFPRKTNYYFIIQVLDRNGQDVQWSMRLLFYVPLIVFNCPSFKWLHTSEPHGECLTLYLYSFQVLCMSFDWETHLAVLRWIHSAKMLPKQFHKDKK